MNVTTIIKIGTRVGGCIIGSCASNVVETAVMNNIPKATNKVVKVANWIGIHAIGIYIGSRIEDAVVNSIRVEQVEDSEDHSYVEVVQAEA